MPHAKSNSTISIKQQETTKDNMSEMVWVIGNKHPNADKSIMWDDPLPNLSDPDIIIIDLTSLTEEVLRRMDFDKIKRATEFIMDKFLNRGTIITITQARFQIKQYAGPPRSNYDMLPLDIHTKKVPEATRIVYNYDEAFTTYLESVKKFSFYISKFDDWKMTHIPKHQGIKKVCRPLEGFRITDNSGHWLGRIFHVFLQDNNGEIVSQAEDSGELVFLPPPTEHIDNAIGKILQECGKATSKKESEPQWASRLSFKPVENIQKQIDECEQNKQKLQSKIHDLTKKKESILSHRRLIYSNGSELEESVGNAFRILGFSEIKRPPEQGKEDWIFDCKNSERFKHVVIEVKGADKRTRQEHIVQCNKWTDERYRIDGKISKGVFVPNQCRKDEYPKSQKNRMHFEPNEIEYAESKEICIIPSCVVFEAVRDVINGRKVDRKKIEEKIVKTNGILTSF